MKTDRQLLDKLAKLAYLNISDGRAEKLMSDMDEMIGFANKLSELDTSGVDATAQILPLENVTRKDVVVPSFDRDEILKNAPDREANGLQVPPIIG